MKPILYYFQGKKIYAVTDGRKPAEKSRKKTFDWQMPESESTIEEASSLPSQSKKKSVNYAR